MILSQYGLLAEEGMANVRGKHPLHTNDNEGRKKKGKMGQQKGWIDFFFCLRLIENRYFFFSWNVSPKNHNYCQTFILAQLVIDMDFEHILLAPTSSICY